MKALPLILIAGWGHTGEAMLRLKEALDGQGCVILPRERRVRARGLQKITEIVGPVPSPGADWPKITQPCLDEYPVQVISTGELWQTQSSGALSRAPGLSRYAVGLHNLLAIRQPPDERVGVIGWSMGGIVALETAREYPGLLQRLVIISGTARFCAGNDEPPGVSASVLRAMALGLRQTPDNVLATYYDQVHAPQDAPTTETAARLVGRGVLAEPCPLDRDELIQGLDYLQRIDLRKGLNQLAVPTLVLHGREDRIVPWQAGEWLSRALAVSHWRCHEGLGHALPIQAATLLAADIRAFLLSH